MAWTSLAMNLLTSQQNVAWNSQLHFQVHNLLDKYIMKLPNSWRTSGISNELQKPIVESFVKRTVMKQFIGASINNLKWTRLQYENFIWVYMHIMFLMLYLMIILMDLFGNTTAILNSIVSNNYYGMLGGKLVCVSRWLLYRQKGPLS